MSYNKLEAIKFVQRYLGKKDDGIITNDLIFLIGGKTNFPAVWDKERKVIGYFQFILQSKYPPLKIDGYFGENTLLAFDIYRGVKLPVRNDHKLDRSIKTQYPNYASISKFYGSIEEVKHSIVSVRVPYQHITAWNLNEKINTVRCHKLIADIYVDVLEEVLSVYGEKDIIRLRLNLFGGSYVEPPRLMRGGSKYSTHCWGSSFDYDPERNTLKMNRNEASFAKPDYREWLDAWNKRGAVNLGELKNFDWMHTQFSRP